MTSPAAAGSGSGASSGTRSSSDSSSDSPGPFRPTGQRLGLPVPWLIGLIVLVFLVIHLFSFKFGPGVAEGYVVEVEGTKIRDLKRLMTENFQNPLYAFGYPFVVILLGFHLRHGVWSAFQSLGAMNPKLTPIIYTIGVLLAVLVTVGFIVVPLYISFSHL